MIRQPSTSDIHELCDWAELMAATRSRPTTQGDIVKLVQPDDSRIDNPSADEHEATEDERIADDVLSLAVKRAAMLDKAYPFVVNNKILSFKYSKFGDAYLFYLLFSAASNDMLCTDARHFFEVESKSILHEYFGGESYHFGWTALNANKGKIQKRIEGFCETTTLGWKPRQPVNLSAQNNDVGVDLLVWRQLPDSRANTLVFVGQCASGHDWRGKLATSAIKHLEDCLQETKDGPWINCFCTPFHIQDTIWRECARSHDGLLFDRIRLIMASSEVEAKRLGVLRNSTCTKWLSKTLKKMQATTNRTPVKKPRRRPIATRR